MAQVPGKVLIIGIDGCRPDALLAANAPVIQGLLPNAVYSFDALTRAPTWSGTGWSSMLTGVWQEKHGVLDNTFAGSNYGAYPHFIHRAETSNPAFVTQSIVHWSPINTQISTLCDVEINVTTDLAVKNNAVDALMNQDNDILFVAFDDVDHTGHSDGFSPTVPSYMATIATTDGYVGEIMDALLGRPNFEAENWLVLLTTDHGGLSTSHGGTSLEERNIFYIAWQKGRTPQEITEQGGSLTQSVGMGLNGSSQYLVPTSSAPFVWGNNQDFSVEMRIRYSSLTGDAPFIGNKNWNSGANRGWVISTPTNNVNRWKVNVGDGTDRIDVTGGTVGDGQWHHISVTFDRDGLMSLYEDGNPVGQTNMAAIDNIDPGFPLVIGQDGTLGYSDYFGGEIAEVRIWNAVLAPEAILAYTCAPLDASHPNAGNLVAHWALADGAGSSPANAADAANPLLLMGGAPDWSVTPGSIACSDYSATPRIVDIAVTALTHLCVPIDPAWGLDGQSVGGQCAESPLGVVWGNFDVSAGADCNITVRWDTPLLTSVSHLDLERSTNGIHFVAIHRFDTGSTASGLFAHTDTSAPGGGRRYYRVKATDYDGTVSYSPIQVIQSHCATAAAWQLLPNPVGGKGQSQLLGTDLHPHTLRLFAPDGKMLREQTFSGGTCQLPASGLLPGVYHLEVQATTGGSVEHLRWVVQ